MLGTSMHGGPKGISYTYVGYTQDTVDRSSYSLTGVAIGTAAASRIVVCVIHTGSSTTAATTITAVTIGGVAATRAAHITGNFAAVEIWAARVPTGTTATIQVTPSEAVLRCLVWTYALYGAATPSAYDWAGYDAASVSTGSVEVLRPHQGVVIGTVSVVTTGTTNITWSGVAEDHESVAESARRGSSASIKGAAGAVTVEAAVNVAVTRYTLLAATFR